MMSRIELIQWLIIKLLIERFKYDDEETVDEYLKKRQRYDLNAEIIAILLSQRDRLSSSLLAVIERAEERIDEHIAEQWGDGEIEHDTQQYIDQATEMMNTFVILALLDSGQRLGTVHQLYNEVLSEIKKTPIEPDTSIKDVIHVIVASKLQGGLSSGFVTQNNHQWKLDRYVMQIMRHAIMGTYNDTLVRELDKRNIELVQVESFAEPRDACAALQASGIICIVPRYRAQLENLAYPNIHDAEHMYREPGGHHGYNCRHVWHRMGNYNLRNNLFIELDNFKTSIDKSRKRLSELVKINLR